MRTSSRLAGAIGVVGMSVSATLSQPMPSTDPVIGSWYLQTVELEQGNDARTCVAAVPGDDPEEMFIAQIGDLGVTNFTYKSPAASLKVAGAADVRLSVDGAEIELAEVQPRDGGAYLTATAKGRMEGSILRAIENGRQIVVVANGHRTTFELVGTKQAMHVLSQCDIAGGSLPPHIVAEAVAQANADRDERASNLDADGLAAYFDQEPAFAQLRCFIDATAFVGIYGHNQPPTDVSVSFHRNGGGMVNGQTLEPVHVRSAGGEPELVVYRGRELMRALLHISGSTHGFDNRLNNVLNEHFGQTLQFVPANRVFGFSIADEQVVVLDQASDGSMSHVGASECYRQR